MRSSASAITCVVPVATHNSQIPSLTGNPYSSMKITFNLGSHLPLLMGTLPILLTQQIA